MAIHVFVVGERPRAKKMPNDSEIDAVAALSEKYAESSEVFFVRRCQSPQSLVRVVREIAVNHGRIDTLDLHDHGASGRIQMGDALLFTYEGIGFDIASQLRPLLATNARLRLLGCNTAIGRRGRDLLRQLHRAMGGDVVVYGTITAITMSQFDERGFRRKHIEELYLYSSTEANRDDSGAPSFRQRDNELISWGAEQRRLLES